MVRRMPPIVFLLLVVWLALDGVSSPLVGFAVIVLAAAAGAWLAPPGPQSLRLSRLPVFAAFFVYESIRGAVDVALRAFRPRMDLDLQLVGYSIALPAGRPRTLLVAVVSLLPGTLSAALHAEDNRLLVHSLTGNPEPAVRSLEVQIARLFGCDGT